MISMTTDMSEPAATLVIATHNRRELLARAVQSALGQSVPLEIIVLDDASADGTAEFVESEFPTVRLQRFSTSAGYIVRRNQGAQLASAPFIFSLDDDAVYSTPDVVRQTLDDFFDAQVGAVAIPCVDILKSPDRRQPYPDDGRRYVTSEFIGTAYAVRKSAFSAIGGFREQLFHQGEERDFCARLWDARFAVLLGSSDPIHHFESPVRDMARMDVYGRRNDICYAFNNVPGAMLPVHLMATTWNGIRFGFRNGHPGRTVRGLVKGFSDGMRSWKSRAPIGLDTYRLLQQLRRQRFAAWSSAEGFLSASFTPLPTALP
jgi:glycosyltransferase involved in cell wall biosynthesis